MSINSVLASTKLAAATIFGLGTYFLGLSSLSNVLITDESVQKVKNSKDELEVVSSIPRGTDIKIK